MRITLLRRSLVAGVTAVLLGLAGAASACVPQPLVTLQPRESGPAGSEVTVNAVSVAGEAEIRWNGTDGPLLAKATGPAFSTPMKVPDAEPGLYAVVVLERTRSGSVGSTARASFLVTGPDSDPGTGSAAPGRPGAPPETVASPPGDSSADDDGVPIGVALAAGGGLAVLGGIGGVTIGRRRSASEAPGTA